MNLRGGCVCVGEHSVHDTETVEVSISWIQYPEYNLLQHPSEMKGREVWVPFLFCSFNSHEVSSP